MLFNSWPFIVLVVVTGLLYYGVCKTENQQIGLLITSSLVFYSYSQVTLLLLLVLSIVLNSMTCYFIDNAKSSSLRRLWAVLGISLNLGILVAFKYGTLLSVAFMPDPQSAGGIGSWLLHLPLPIGISFYTFQGISLVVDTFTGDVQRKNQRVGFLRAFRDNFFFISFFPQLVAGPVLKAKQFLPQIEKKKGSSVNVSAVMHCLLTGYFLKLVVADNLKDITYWIQFPFFQHKSSIDLVVMLVSFSAQIFADFAGYSLIAIGVAGIFGYQLPKNFDFPYISLSISEFWRRWHISLSAWLREYLYVPLGGNRKGHVRTYVNLIVVMFLGGLWHGAAWSFAIWGLWHGLGLAVERVGSSLIASRQGKLGNDRPRVANLLIAAIRWTLVFAFVTLGWLLFELTDISEALSFLSALANNIAKPPDMSLFLVAIFLIFPVALYHLLYLVSSYTDIQVEVYRDYLYGAMFFLIMFNAGSSETFVYFQF